MYILNIVRAIKKMSVNEIRGFIFENYCNIIGFSKESSCYSMKRSKKDLLLPANKLMGKMLDPLNTKEYCQSFIRKKYKISKTIRNYYLSTKNF